MFFLSDFSDFFGVSVAVFSLSAYLVLNITYSVSFSSFQQLSFPQINGLNSTNIVFLLLLLLACSDCGSFLEYGKQSAGNHSFYNSIFQSLLMVSITCFFFITSNFVKSKKIVNFEYNLLINFAIIGLLLINSCENLLTFYLAIELQSLCFYVLACLNKNSSHCAEAALKYFILGAFSSGLLLFGFILFYAAFGSISFECFERLDSTTSLLVSTCGCFFFSVALLFKLGSFPFHMWLCDVYEGSMLNVTAFFSTVPKLILFAFFIKLNFEVFFAKKYLVSTMLLFSALGSVCFASVVALYQKRVKRLVAYSTISHTGFIILAIGCMTVDSVKTTMIYLVLYILMSLTLFAILCLSSINNNKQKYIINWASFFDRNFSMAFAFAIVIFSTAGIPPLAGFYSKLCVLTCLISNGHVLIAVVVAIFSSIACFYYIRLIKILFFGSAASRNWFWLGSGTNSVESFIGISMLLIVMFLLAPNLLINLATIAATSLV
jgi:NADH-quinone oxidoreductase subunit N